jgi:hypothetical protein
MKIRDAVVEDAPAAYPVMRRSISELCAADHHDDPGNSGGVAEALEQSDRS